MITTIPRGRRGALLEKPAVGAALNMGHPLNEGLVTLFALNECGGLKTVDALNRVFGTLTSHGGGANPDWTPRGPEFSPSNSCIDLTQPALFNLSKFSLEVWWQSAADGNAYAGPFQAVISGQNGFMLPNNLSASNTYRPNLVIHNGTSETAHWVGATTLNYPFGKFIQFVATYDGTTGKIYLDGVDDGATDTGTTGYSSATEARIGNAYSNVNCKGVIAKVAVWNRVLKADEVRWLRAEPWAQFLGRRRFAPKIVAGGGGGGPTFFFDIFSDD